jgi:hypothetical protein
MSRIHRAIPLALVVTAWFMFAMLRNPSPAMAAPLITPRQTPEVTHIHGPDVDVYSHWNTALYIPEIMLASGNYSANTDAKPTYQGPAGNATWWNSGCYTGSIWFTASNFGITGWPARALPRRLPQGRSPCDYNNFIDCISSGRSTGNCSPGNMLAHLVHIQINLSYGQVQPGQPLVLYTIAHEMGHAFGQYHWGIDPPSHGPWECFQYGQNTLMWGQQCEDLGQRRSDVGPWDQIGINQVY